MAGEGVAHAIRAELETRRIEGSEPAVPAAAVRVRERIGIEGTVSDPPADGDLPFVQRRRTRHADKLEVTIEVAERFATGPRYQRQSRRDGNCRLGDVANLHSVPSWAGGVSARTVQRRSYYRRAGLSFDLNSKEPPCCASVKLNCRSGLMLSRK